MWFYEAIAAAIFFSISGILFKANSRNRLSSEAFFFYLYAAGSLSLFTYILGARELELDFRSITAGMVIGIGIGAGNYLFAKALRVGPISLTSPIINFNVVFLVIGAVLYYGEPINLKSGLLIALLILSMLILAIDPEEKVSIRSRSWYFFVLLASLFFALRNGGLKVTNELGIDPDSVLFIGYLEPAVVLFRKGTLAGACQAPPFVSIRRHCRSILRFGHDSLFAGFEGRPGEPGNSPVFNLQLVHRCAGLSSLQGAAVPPAKYIGRIDRHYDCPAEVAGTRPPSNGPFGGRSFFQSGRQIRPISI